MATKLTSFMCLHLTWRKLKYIFIDITNNKTLLKQLLVFRFLPPQSWYGGSIILFNLHRVFFWPIVADCNCNASLPGMRYIYSTVLMMSV